MNQQREAGMPRPVVSPAQRLLMLDAWMRSSVSAKSFTQIVGEASSTLSSWKKRSAEDGRLAIDPARRPSSAPA